MPTFFGYFPLIFVVIGFAVALAAVRGEMHARAWARKAQRVPGTVTDVQNRFSGSGRHLRASPRPVLAFTTLEGRQVTTESRQESGHGVGNEIEVLYDPANPTDAEIDEGSSLLSGLGQVAVGLVIAAIGFGFFVAFTDFADEWRGDVDSGTVQCSDENGDEVDCPPGFFEE
ncbi:DUF3592 domain-containing protein [Actinocorallia aurantiaca]|uniref:DUF3592 domain-containing protein n=1 Tax=Actinocorallia aurantiaca TaxID=46204 RepID=A0ABP6GP94_9ACTN